MLKKNGESTVPNSEVQLAADKLDRSNHHSSKRILLIDDESSLRRVIQLVLEKLACWEVLMANSGREGLQQAEIGQPHAILLDWMMPDLDGLATLTKLRENPTTRKIPVIILTADVQAVEKLQALEVAAILIKPFEPETLILQIKAALDWA